MTDQSVKILERAHTKHDPVMIYAGMSGGRDSLAVTHLTMEWADRHGYPAKVLHLNTGIGIEKTRQFVRDVCKQQGWPLLEVRAKEDCGQDYEQLVLEHGFPGPSHHTKMYNRLKERGVEYAVRKAKEGHSRMRRVLISTGIRAEESAKRSGYNRVEHRRGGQVWLNPIYRWTSNQRDAYIDRHDLPINPVSKVLGMSGECLCGAYAHKGEKDLVRIVDPATAEYIDDLEQRVKDRGFPWGWEHPGPPRRWLLEREGQMNAFQPLCTGCGKSNE